MATQYYMLVASLPHLPHFTKADRLPINPQRLRWRRAALEPQDASDLDEGLNLLHWPRHPLERTDVEVDAQYRAAMNRIRNPIVRPFVDQMMGSRSVMAGLRRKQLQKPAATGEERCGVGRWNGLVRNRWEREDFGLSALFSWIPQARTMLAQGQAAELERLQMETDWREASRIADADPFAFPAVFAYLIKWDILSRWLSRDATKATEVFTQMVDEVVHEQ